MDIDMSKVSKYDLVNIAEAIRRAKALDQNFVVDDSLRTVLLKYHTNIREIDFKNLLRTDATKFMWMIDFISHEVFTESLEDEAPGIDLPGINQEDLRTSTSTAEKKPVRFIIIGDDAYPMAMAEQLQAVFKKRPDLMGQALLGTMVDINTDGLNLDLERFTVELLETIMDEHIELRGADKKRPDPWTVLVFSVIAIMLIGLAVQQLWVYDGWAFIKSMMFDLFN